jgi:Zn-dependent protease with chaperone function
MTSKAWLVARGLLAITLMVGFYALALGIVIALLWIPYAEVMYVGRVHLKLTLVVVVAALSVLWAILPRIDRFNPPGPRLDEYTCPELFRMIREVASATGQSEPSEVYLLNEVNAWVSQRGGVMGFGSRRVMGIGFPLLQGLSVEELRAILAHEFGHYSSGDVALGPWIYKTRAAIGRAIGSMRDSWLEAPFRWYGKQFLRITHGISRQQEFIADRIAAQVTSTTAAASALRQTLALAPAFHAYLGQEVVPVMRAGFMPPIANGFAAFLREERIADFARRFVEQEVREGKTDAFDTHPSLKERLAALGDSSPLQSVAGGGGSAAALLPNAEQHVAALARCTFGAQNVEGLKPLAWSEVGDSVIVPQWRALSKSCAAWLSRFTPDTLPATEEELLRAGKGLTRPGDELSKQDRIGRAVHVFGVGVALALLDRGWVVETGVGRPAVMRSGSQVIDPFDSVHRLATGQLGADEWKAQCAAAGIAGCVLGGGAAARA